jgi:hypothetical protein
MTVRSQARRSSPPLLLPMIRPLLDDPDQDIHDQAVGALRRCGAASGQFSDELSGSPRGSRRRPAGGRSHRSSRRWRR